VYSRFAQDYFEAVGTTPRSQPALIQGLQDIVRLDNSLLIPLQDNIATKKRKKKAERERKCEISLFTKDRIIH